VVVEELAPGLWRWTEQHPEWTRSRGEAEGWGPQVASVYCEADGDVLLIDPVLPRGGSERERFWRALDRDVARMARSPRILLTSDRHTRGTPHILERYPSATLWAPAQGAPLAGLVVDIVGALPGEVLFWLPSHRALVAGDTLVGGAAGDVRFCRDASSGGRDPAAVRAELWDRLHDLPVERLLVSHGEPVLMRGRDALALALHA
jgi:hypothetical protein